MSEVIDRCQRDGCKGIRVSRSINSVPLKTPWYCSRMCREIATRPVHWLFPGEDVSACGHVNRNSYPHLVTDDREKVTCGACKRTGIWKEHENREAGT